jgi:hypothetical protein
MILSRLGWACWALVPVVAVAYHFGPGQIAAKRDQAARLQGDAIEAERIAEAAQRLAYEQHLAAIDARRAAFLSKSPADEAQALAATQREDAAYASAAEAWREVAGRIEAVTRVFGTSETPESLQLRLAHGRALVRSGEVWSGIESLESLLTSVEGTTASGANGTKAATAGGSEELATRTREELATAYYYGARLLRLNGMPAQEWMVESGKARQHFRLLAEGSRGGNSGGGRDEDASAERAEAHQRNLELVLNLEQSSLAELQAKPIPRESPSKCQGNRPSNNPGRKSQRPPQEKRDARGAGGAGNVPPGW